MNAVAEMVLAEVCNAMGTTYQVRIPIQRLGTNCRTRGPSKGSTADMSACQHLWNGDIKVPRAGESFIRIRRLDLLRCADHDPAACLRLCSEFSKAVVVVRDGSRFVEDSRHADLMRLVDRHRPSANTPCALNPRPLTHRR